MFSVGAKAGKAVLPQLMKALRGELAPVGRGLQKLGPYVKKGGIVLGYFTVSGVLFMFAEGFRDVGRAHFRDIVYATGIIERPKKDDDGDGSEGGDKK